MLDGVTLDQMRTLLAAADEGSFSAAGRHLGRAQSAVSEAVANLEGQLGLRLFDRATRRPRLTEAGRALLPEARAAVAAADRVRARARALAGGLEPELSVVVDVMFPIAVLTEALAAFRAAFPDTPLRLEVEALGAVLQPVLDGRCAFGVMGSMPTAPPALATEHLRGVEMVMVAAPAHPLAAHPAPIPTRALADHVQLVLTDRSELSRGREFGVLAARTWRLADLGAKHALLRAGLGWGGMPRHMVEEDLAQGPLVALALEDAPAPRFLMPMHAAYPAAKPPGPAGRWLIERLKAEGAPTEGAQR